jgi:hypothetical protein
MKIKWQVPSLNERQDNALISNGWIALKEPGNLGKAIILSIPLMVVNLFVALLIIKLFSSISFEEYGFLPYSFSLTINLGMLWGLIPLVVMHELLHLIFIPNFVRSPTTFIGLTLYGGFVVTEEEITKSRYMLITMAPFIIGSILLPSLLGVTGLLTPTIKLLVLLNAMASSVDVLNALFIIKQVPRSAILKNNGPKTYWKTIDKSNIQA